LLLFLIVFVASCKTTPEKKDEVVDKKVGEEEKKEEPEEGEKQDEEKKGEDKDKEGEEGTEKKIYDGLKYVGPAVKSFRDGTEAYFGKGCKEAIEKWKQSMEEDAENPMIAYNIGLCFSRSGKDPDAEQWYKKSFDIDGKYIKSLYNLYILQQKYARVDKEYFIKISEKIEDNVDRNNFLSWFYLKEGNNEEAIKYAKTCLKEDEQNVDAMVTLGTAYFEKDMIELSTMIFSTAEKINAENFRLQRISGFLAYRQKDKVKAIAHFKKAKKINPELPEVSNMIAILSMETEDYQKAKEELESALLIYPDFYAAKLNLAIASRGLKEYKNSEKVLLELENDEKLPEELKKNVIFNIAILYLDADVDGDRNPERFDKAVEYLEKYKKLIKKRDKKEKKKIADYIKEAKVEKKKLQAILKMKARQDAKRKAAAEEQEIYDKQKVIAYDEALKLDTIEGWAKYLEKFNLIGDDDEKGVNATKRLEELKKIKGVETPPAEGGEQPAEGGEQPAEGGEQPAEGGEQPAEGVEQPAEGGEQPAEGGEQPAEGGEQPAEGVEQPAEGGEKPAEGGEQPAEGGEQPAEGGEQPVEGGEQPAEGGEQPTE